MTAVTTQKYELIKDETCVDERSKLYRLKSLRDFSDVKAGDLGGYVAGPDNLSHEGDCWIYDQACALDNSRICGNSCMYDSSSMNDHSSMHDNSHMPGNSSMHGDATLRGSVILRWEISESPISINTSDGYTFLYNPKEDKISAGCRYFTYDEAIEHWTGTPLGEERLRICAALRAMHSLNP